MRKIMSELYRKRGNRVNFVARRGDTALGSFPRDNAVSAEKEIMAEQTRLCLPRVNQALRAQFRFTLIHPRLASS